MGENKNQGSFGNKKTWVTRRMEFFSRCLGGNSSILALLPFVIAVPRSIPLFRGLLEQKWEKMTRSNRRFSEFEIWSMNLFFPLCLIVLAYSVLIYWFSYWYLMDGESMSLRKLLRRYGIILLDVASTDCQRAFDYWQVSDMSVGSVFKEGEVILKENQCKLMVTAITLISTEDYGWFIGLSNRIISRYSYRNWH